MAKHRAEAHSKTQPVRVKAAAQSRAADLDRLIHEPIRLGIVSALAVNDTMTFNDLKGLLKTTDGNLSVHARKLEEGQVLCNTKYLTSAATRAYCGVHHEYSAWSVETG